MEAIGRLGIVIRSFDTGRQKREGREEFSGGPEPRKYGSCRAKSDIHAIIPILLIERDPTIEESIVENTRISHIEITEMPTRYAVGLLRSKTLAMNRTYNLREISRDRLLWSKTFTQNPSS